MSSALSLLEAKLSRLAKLDADDMEALRSLPLNLKSYPAKTTIVHVGDKPDTSLVLLEGVLLRQKTISTGTQILSLHLPADIPDLMSLYINVMDHELVTASHAKVAHVSHRDLRRIIKTRPRLAAALWRETLIDAALSRSWLVNLGCRKATERVAYFLLEESERRKALGFSYDRFELPLSQTQLGNALGITDVHANRSLKALSLLVSFRHYQVEITDRQALSAFCGFEDEYPQST